MAQTRQRHLYGTTAWSKDYGRRTFVESGNSMIRYHGRIQRHYTRVFGTIKNAMILALAFAAINLHLAKMWRVRHHLRCPYDDTPAPAPTPVRRRRAPRRKSTFNTLVPPE